MHEWILLLSMQDVSYMHAIFISNFYFQVTSDACKIYAYKRKTIRISGLYLPVWPLAQCMEMGSAGWKICDALERKDTSISKCYFPFSSLV